jgi:hypothetical protein
MVLQCCHCAFVSDDVKNRKDVKQGSGRDPVCAACYSIRNRIAAADRKKWKKLQIGNVPTTKMALSYDLGAKPIIFNRHSEFNACGTLVSIKKPAPQMIRDEFELNQAAAVLVIFSKQAYTRSYL